MPIHIKRVYEKPDTGDGLRVLVDRLWPRGLSKTDAKIDFWARDISPSNELRQWYGHDPELWTEFKQRYFAELDANLEAVNELRKRLANADSVAFVFSSKEERLNNAAALKEYLEKRGRSARKKAARKRC